MPEFSIEVHVSRQPAIALRVGKLSRKAEQLGLPAPKVEFSEPFMKVEETGSRRQMVKVTVSGEMPQVAGYEALAALDHTEAGNVVSVLTKDEWAVDPEWRTMTGDCDHCMTSRRRRSTFMLREVATGKVLQVGKTCLKDFGGAELEQVIARAAWWTKLASECEEEGSISSGRCHHLSTVEYVAACCAAIRTWGFQKASEMRPTREDALDVLFPTKEQQEEKGFPTIEDRDWQQAEAAVEWAKALEGRSEFEWNLRVLAAETLVDVKVSRHLGMLAALPSAHARHLGRELERKQRVASLAKGFIGEPGEKVSFVGTLVSVRSFDSDYGTVTLYTFRSIHGNSVKWFSSRGLDHDEIGTEVLVQGTVKKQETYNGIDSTVLTRCKVQTSATA